jgi:hypothetical protein
VPSDEETLRALHAGAPALLAEFGLVAPYLTG